MGKSKGESTKTSVWTGRRSLTPLMRDNPRTHFLRLQLGPRAVFRLRDPVLRLPLLFHREAAIVTCSRPLFFLLVPVLRIAHPYIPIVAAGAGSGTAIGATGVESSMARQGRSGRRVRVGRGVRVPRVAARGSATRCGIPTPDPVGSNGGDG